MINNKHLEYRKKIIKELKRVLIDTENLNFLPTSELKTKYKDCFRKDFDTKTQSDKNLKKSRKAKARFNKKNSSKFALALNILKRYYYYHKQETIKLEINKKQVYKLILRDFNVKIESNEHLISLKENKALEPFKIRSIRKPRTRKGVKNDFRSKYKNYLQSDDWRKKREELFLERGKVCEKCGSKENIQVHHLRYRNLFNEKLEDLQVLCKPCHMEEHEIDENNKKPKHNYRSKEIIEVKRYKRNGVLIEKRITIKKGM